MARFLSLDDLSHLPTPRWLIDGLFEVNSLVMLAGPPASYKSFLALDWALSMVTKRKWHGRATAAARVLYVLGEGKASLLKRIEAWASYHGIDQAERACIVENFRVTFEVPQLALKSSVDNMLAGLVAEGFSPDVIVVDTFARSFVGLDENSQKDTGLWVESADRLRQMGYTVIFLHHTAKNTEFGLKYRGSTAIMGAMDTAFILNKDTKSQTTMTCVKQKDHDEGAPIYMQGLKVRVSPKDEGSIVLIPAIRLDERFTDEFRAKETKIEDTIVDVLAEEATYESKWAMARDLAKKTGLTENAALGRINRWPGRVIRGSGRIKERISN